MRAILLWPQPARPMAWHRNATGIISKSDYFLQLTQQHYVSLIVQTPINVNNQQQDTSSSSRTIIILKMHQDMFFVTLLISHGLLRPLLYILQG